MQFHPTPEVPSLQYVGNVEEGGAAAEAGLKPGDFIVEVMYMGFNREALLGFNREALLGVIAHASSSHVMCTLGLSLINLQNIKNNACGVLDEYI